MHLTYNAGQCMAFAMHLALDAGQCICARNSVHFSASGTVHGRDGSWCIRRCSDSFW